MNGDSHQVWKIKNPLGIPFLYRLGSCSFLSLSYVIIGILKEEMDLSNFIVVLGITHLWSVGEKELTPTLTILKENCK